MQTWAEREIDLACKRERAAGSAVDEDWDYGCACYESAYKAFQSLLADGHSGMSITFVKEILNRLIDGKPLTPIEDTPDVWSGITDTRGGRVSYQCDRMSSLFKDVYSDGTVKYHDINAFLSLDKGDTSYFHFGFVSNLMDELFPITMPYYPPVKATIVHCETALTSRTNGDFDTQAILYAIRPNGERVEINRYFKDSDSPTGWDEISKEEFDDRLEMQRVRIANEQAEGSV